MSDARWYTSARRFPQLIGRTPDGSKLAGGPYTILQLVVGGVVLFVLWNTTWLWARGGLFVNIAIGGGLLFGSVWLTGRLPYNLRNPLVVVGGWVHALERATGRAADVRLPRACRPVGGQVLMLIPPTTTITAAAPVDDVCTPTVEPAGDAAAEGAPVTGASRPTPPPVVPDPGPVGALVGGPALSGVQRLLASAGSSTPRP